MEEESIRYYLEQTYGSARKLFMLLVNEDWPKFAANFPPANKLSLKQLAGLTSDLNEIVQNKMQEAGIIKDNELNKQKNKISELLVDSVTGLSTRNHFTEIVKKITLQELKEHSYTIIVIDVNRLKYLNDNHGHIAGDQYLKTLGDAINSSLHKNDQAFRVGGDEIAVIPHISEADAIDLIKMDSPLMSKADIMLKAADIITNRILGKFQKLWSNKFGFKSGFSYGIANLDESLIQNTIYGNTDVKDIINVIFSLADKRQYAHKNMLKQSGQYYDLSIVSDKPEQVEGTVKG